MTSRTDCPECRAAIDADTVEALGEAFLSHARAHHQWPFPDQAVRNYAEATQRLTGGEQRLDEIGAVEVHPVTADRLDDWLAFFDHDAFVGTPEWAACYCLEPHVRRPDQTDMAEDVPHWKQSRSAMVERLQGGRSHGYLAYVDGRPAGWVNASRRSDYTLYELAATDAPDGDEVIGVACFIIAPPYRRHGMAALLLDRVIADAPGRGAGWVEAYPFNEDQPGDARNFRGPRSMFEARGFEVAGTRERDMVMRLAVPAPPE